MRTTSLNHASVVSSQLFTFLATSQKLRRLLVPQNLFLSPYEILDYHATLTLHDQCGMHATFERTQRIRFLQDRVGAILDHLWGDGVLVTDYETDAGNISDSVRDRGVRHLVIRLRRVMARGEEFTFSISRTAISGFTKPEEYLETIIDHPIGHVRCSVIFPTGRPCRFATSSFGEELTDLPVTRREDGRSTITMDVARPLPDAAYTIRWTW